MSKNDIILTYILGGFLMKLEQQDLSMLFSYTDLPDVFFTEYLSQAPGDFVKVYLYILFLSLFYNVILYLFI